MDVVKEAIHKRTSKRERKKSKQERGLAPQLSEVDLNFIAQHTSINKEDVSTT